MNATADLRNLKTIKTLAEYELVTERIKILEEHEDLNKGHFNQTRAELDHGKMVLRKFQKKKGCVTSLRVADLLERNGVGFDILARGYRKREGLGLDGKPWECDAWELVLHNGKTSHRFDYFTGLGHRVNSVPKPAGIRAGTLAYEQWERSAVAQTPGVAGIIHSLIMDDVSGMSFSEWCDEFGYDSDSRKVLALYDECEKNTKKTREIFSREIMAQLREVLQDY